MHELDERLADAVTRVESQWDDTRTRGVWVGLERKRARRRVVRAGAAALAIVAVVGGGVWWSSRSKPVGDTIAELPEIDPAQPSPPMPEVGAELVLSSVVTPEGDASIDIVPIDGDRVAIDVVRGKGNFAVPLEAMSRVDVTAGDITFAVYASEFSVARFGEQADVWVGEGYLEVLYDGATQRVTAGETRRFGPPLEISADDVEPIALSDHERQRVSTDWRPLAKDGNFDDAFAALERAGGTSAVRDDVSDLLLAADVFRITGHPSKAVVPLERVVSRYRNDPRTPLAAFTLGRVLLDELGRPAAAATAFHTARDLAPTGGLAEDALAREVEAWSKAGKLGKARGQAELYIQSYPRGHRLRAVKKYGGL